MARHGHENGFRVLRKRLEWARQAKATQHVRVRLTNQTYAYSHDHGSSWTVHGTRMEVSGLHHNVFGGFLSLRVGLYATGSGGVRFGDVRYKAIR